MKLFLAHTPALKLLLPFITGILFQWYFQPAGIGPAILFVVSVSALLVFFSLPAWFVFRLGPWQGLLIMLAFMAAGMLSVYMKDARHTLYNISAMYKPGMYITAMLNEAPVEKAHSFKAGATITSCGVQPAAGSINIYFKKDSAAKPLTAGSLVAFNAPMQEIKNSGNPGAFDYKRYALFNGITHQVFLSTTSYVILPKKPGFSLTALLQKTRQWTLDIIRTNIIDSSAQGLAAALLIGYKADVDKSILQSYSNTGVSHIIAVSGMHLALIYWLLNILFTPLLKLKRIAWLHPVLIIGLLWLFTFITGGAASIARAAVMFTFITIGKNINRNAPIYNTLALSALLLLCYDPFWLWDVGFLLSYTAVLSIVIFYSPIRKLLFIKNKWICKLWELIAVTIAAQVLTAPLVVYYFHQFPLYFIPANLVAVPLSSAILIGELVLIIVAPLKPLALWLGFILEYAIQLLNHFIAGIEKLPMSVWSGLQVSVVQVLLLYIFIAALGFFWLHRLKQSAWWALSALLLLLVIRDIELYQSSRQQKLIVYNINRTPAIDLINGSSVTYIGTDSLNLPALAQYHLQPARLLHRAVMTKLSRDSTLFFANRRIAILHQPVQITDTINKIPLDFLILSGNPRLYLHKLLQGIVPGQVIIDASVPAWKARFWQKDCDSLHIPCHNVAEKGAFVMNLR